MTLKTKVQNVWRRIRQSWGSPQTKRELWNREFATGRWDSIEHTEGDVIYDFIQRYSASGSILDLGCGAGNTGCELRPESYREYTGVDISDVALAKAAERSRQCGRASMNRYAQADILTYVPDRKHEVILLRESIYYIPRSRIKATLVRYSSYLTENAVLIVRRHDPPVGARVLQLIGTAFKTVENRCVGSSGPVIVVFRPHTKAQQTRVHQ